MTSQSKGNTDNVLPQVMRQSSNFMAGAFSGLTSAICVAPFDVLKTRQQVQFQRLGEQAKYPKNPFLGLRVIFIDEGIRGLFRGLPTTVLGYVPNWGIYWACYTKIKFQMEESNQLPKISQSMLAATFAGGLSAIITNPFWVIRTRIQTQEIVSKHSEYRSTITAFEQIYKYEGIKGFYRGLPASLVGLGHVAIQFPIYESCKEELQKHSTILSEHPTLNLIVSSCISKIFACCFTYPHEVIRSRLHLERKERSSLISLVRKAVSEEGVFVLYRFYKK
eukprot:c20626_g1_i3.p1 GENE.c20626_g1_i3~~c20626_g1_i3.p1  ORF type:complete len:278 (-),score=80.37 c20626_g1_i3:226-1059(-)